MSNRKMWEMNKRLYRTLSHDGLLEVADELTDLAAEREEMLALIVECKEYLDINEHTSIGSTSILHKKMADIVAKANAI